MAMQLNIFGYFTIVGPEKLDRVGERVVKSRETTSKPNNGPPLQWTKDAYYCHKTEQDCDNCPIKTHYNLNKCHMPKTVDKLLKNNVSIPESLRKKPRRKKDEGFEFSVQGTLRINSTTAFITD